MTLIMTMVVWVYIPRIDFVRLLIIIVYLRLNVEMVLIVVSVDVRIDLLVLMFMNIVMFVNWLMICL